MSGETSPSLVPELNVSSLEKSMRFWCSILGFDVRYSRLEEGFCYLTKGSAHVMLEQHSLAHRNWFEKPLTFPFGNGINFQLEVDDMDLVLIRMSKAELPLYLEVEEKWYTRGAEEIGQKQCIVQDPDGYLVRLCTTLGTRPCQPAGWTGSNHRGKDDRIAPPRLSPRLLIDKSGPLKA